MANKTVTLYIDDTSLRLMVIQGRQIKEWSESPLKQGLVENNVVIGEAEVAAKIKQLFAVQRIRTKRIVLGISGLRCMTRPITLPRLPKEMLDEAVRREAQRVLPVPLEELYLSWQLISGTEEQTAVFMVGIPRKTADALHRTLELAGLKPSFMEIKPVALTRAVKEATAIIVDVQATEFDIIVKTDGIPYPLRSIRFASGALSGEEKLTTIKNELNRVIAFYNTNNPLIPPGPAVDRSKTTGLDRVAKALAPGVPVFACGDLSSQPEQCQSLSVEVGHPVLPLVSPLESPEGLNPGHYMTNISLACPVLPSKERSGATSIALNALPILYQTKAVSLPNVLTIPGAVVTVGLLAVLVLVGQSLSADVASINTKLDSTNQLIQQKQSQQRALSGKLTELQRNVNTVTTSLDSLTRVLDVLEKQAQSTEQDLAAAMDNLPQNLNLNSVRHVANVLTVMGRAANENQILSYITKLDKSGLFGNIVITDMTREAGGLMDFTVVGTLHTQGMGASSMEVALGSLPLSVILTGFSSDESALSIAGTAPDADKVFAYLRALEASGKFSEITVASMTRTDQGTMNFSLVLKTGA